MWIYTWKCIEVTNPERKLKDLPLSEKKSALLTNFSFLRTWPTHYTNRHIIRKYIYWESERKMLHRWEMTTIWIVIWRIELQVRCYPCIHYRMCKKMLETKKIGRKHNMKNCTTHLYRYRTWENDGTKYKWAEDT